MKLQKEKIIAVIQKDANYVRRYFGPEEGQCCVIGGLLVAAGIEDEYKSTIKCFCNAGSIEAASEMEKARDLLYNTYGLSTGQQTRLQTINDDCDETEERREQLIIAVEEMAQTEEALTYLEGTTNVKA